MENTIGSHNMENTTFLQLLNLISALEWKIAPLPFTFPRLEYEHCFFVFGHPAYWDNEIVTIFFLVFT